MFTHTTATLEGLSTIRAFRAEHRLIQEYDQHQNLNSSAWFLFVATSSEKILSFYCFGFVKTQSLTFRRFRFLRRFYFIALHHFNNFQLFSTWNKFEN